MMKGVAMSGTTQAVEQTTQRNQTLPMVRAQVKDILTRSTAFRALPKDRQLALASDMVKVAHFIVGDSEPNTPRAVTFAGNQPQGQRPDPAGQTAGERFQAAAARQGTQAFTEQIADVNFPQFVASLVDGVFTAIVDSSIKQMEAYAELVKNVAKSVDQYMKDNITPNQARDYLATSYPDYLEVDLSGEAPKLKPREGHDEDSLPDFFADLGLKAPVKSLDEDVVEEQLVPAARRRMAMDRQQMLATMVLMGINRLVVIDGKLEASVIFELATKDKVKRGFNLTTDYDYTSRNTREWGNDGKRTSEGREGGFLGIFGGRNVKRESTWYNKNYHEDNVHFTMHTMRREDSEASVDLKTKLSGRVNINFKSETFPLERMADVLQIQQIRDKAPGAAFSNQAGNQPGNQPNNQAASQTGQAGTQPAAGNR
jgi:hypothetical protein